MRPRHFLAALAVLLTLPATAAAAPLPDPETHLIVVPTSIGGVEIGQSLHNAAGQWGHRSICNRRLCEYGRPHGPRGYASIQAGRKGVEYVWIDAVYQHGHADFAGPLMKFETASGIGLRSSIAKLKRAYPQAYRAEAGWRVDGPDGSYMLFSGSSERIKGRTRIVAIALLT
jgi:hypothetical protein